MPPPTSSRKSCHTPRVSSRETFQPFPSRHHARPRYLLYPVDRSSLPPSARQTWLIRKRATISEAMFLGRTLTTVPPASAELPAVLPAEAGGQYRSAGAYNAKSVGQIVVRMREVDDSRSTLWM